MKMLRKFILMLFALSLAILSACSDATRSPVTSLAASPGGVGVYSALPNAFQNTHVGTTVFNNSYTEFDTRSWGMNTFAERELAAALRRAGVAKVSVIPTPNRAIVSSPIFGKRANKALTPVFDAAHAANLDKVAILEPGASLSQINNRTGAPPAYGYFSLGALGNIAAQFEYVDIYLNVYDVETQTRLSTSSIATRAVTSELSLFVVEFAKPVSGVPFREAASSYSVAEKRQLEATIKRLFRQSLAAALMP